MIDRRTLSHRCRTARYEFRAWNVGADLVDRFEQSGDFGECNVICDQYLVGPIGTVNVKIRDGELQVKRLLGFQSGFERWCPTWEPRTPLHEGECVRLWGELGLDAPTLFETIVADEIVDLASEDPDLVVVDVTKRRREGTVHGVSAEVTELRRGDDTTTSVALEGTDVDRLGAVRSETGLDRYENLAVHVAVAHKWPEVTGVVR